jgi:DNA-binding NarL/FixJ family response regulator
MEASRMSALKVILADDEAPARQFIRRLLNHHEDLVIIGEAEDGLENGIISGVNLLAKTLGIQVNMAVKDAVKLIVLRPPSKTPH